MSFNFRPEEYYKRFIELQEKLRKSEEERLKLEMKFNEMVRVTREEEQIHYRKLRTQYKRFLEEDRKRQDRNERIIRTLERIENRVTVLVAKTERFKLLRQQYQTFLDRVNKTNQINKPKVPEISKMKENVKPFRATGDGNDIVQTYLQNLSSNKLREMLKKEEEARARLPINDAQDLDDKYSYPSLYTLNGDTRPNYANSIADDILNSIYLRSSKFANDVTMQPRELNNNLTSTLNQSEPQPLHSYDATPPIINYSRMQTVREPKNVASEVEESETDDFSESEEILYKNPTEFNKGKLKSGIAKDDRTFINEKIGGEPLHIIKPEKPCPITAKENGFNKHLVKNDGDSSQKFVNSPANDLSGTNKVQVSSEKLKVRENDTFHKGDATDLAGKTKEDNNIDNPVIKEEKFKHQVVSEQISVQGPNFNKTREETVEATKESVKPTGNIDSQKQGQPEQLSLQQNVVIQEQRSTETKESTGRVEPNKEKVTVEEQIDKLEIQGEPYDVQPVNKDDHVQQSYEQFESNQPIEQQNGTVQPEIYYDEQGQPVQSLDQQQYDEHGQPIQSLMQQYDEYGQPYAFDQNQYGEHGQPIPPFDQQQYDENGQPVRSSNQHQYDQQDQPIESFAQQQYDEHGQPVQSFDQQQYDEHGQLVQSFEQQGELTQHYDDQGHHIQPYQDNVQYDEQGQFVPQYDEHGQLIQQYEQQYDESGQLIQQYDDQYGANQQQYDENGQLIQQYDDQYGANQQQYDENGQLIQQYGYDQDQSQPQYDENGQLINYSQPHYDENGQLIQDSQQYENQQYYTEQFQENVEASGNQNLLQVSQDENEEKIVETGESVEVVNKTSNVMEMLDTDTESIKQDTKTSHDSDFDLSNS